MNNISDCIDFVQQQIDYQDRRATMTRGDQKKLNFHIETAKQFRSLLQFLESIHDNPAIKSQPLSDIDPIGALLPKELIGLPQEVIDELSAKGTDKQELLIIELIEASGGILSLDRILIGIYKSSGAVIKRPALTAKLYRMAQNGTIFKVAGKKGLYTTEQAKGESS